MTHRANLFLKANRRSPVVYGSVIAPDNHPTRRGCYYRLADGQTFELNAGECRLIGHPRWAHMATEPA